MNRRRCIGCDKKKIPSDFSIGETRGGRIYRFRKCKECRADSYRAKYRENPKKAREAAYKNKDSRKIRDWNLRFLYGMTLLEWEILFNKQGRRCAICKKNKTGGRGWNTDHRGHHTKYKGKKKGRVRGILCNHCNTFIGLAKESPRILREAIKYLRKHAK